MRSEKHLLLFIVTAASAALAGCGFLDSIRTGPGQSAFYSAPEKVYFDIIETAVPEPICLPTEVPGPAAATPVPAMETEMIPSATPAFIRNVTAQPTAEVVRSAETPEPTEKIRGSESVTEDAGVQTTKEPQRAVEPAPEIIVPNVFAKSDESCRNETAIPAETTAEEKPVLPAAASEPAEEQRVFVSGDDTEVLPEMPVSQTGAGEAKNAPVAIPVPSGNTSRDALVLAARVAYFEAGGRSDDGYRAVLSVLYNRCMSIDFGGRETDIATEVFRKSQFSVAKKDSFFTAEIPESIVSIAEDVFLRGGSSLPAGVIFFRSASVGKEWGDKVYYDTIGGNAFFYKNGLE